MASNRDDELLKELYSRIIGYTGARTLPESKNRAMKAAEAILPLFQAIRQEEIGVLQSLDLEFNVAVCDCGKPWTPSDAHDIVLNRIDELNGVKDIHERLIEARVDELIRMRSLPELSAESASRRINRRINDLLAEKDQ